MSIDAYQSVSCDLHSQFELLAMHRREIRLTVMDELDQQQIIDCQVEDIKTSDGAEYLVVSKDDQCVEFRLDRILSFSPL